MYDENGIKFDEDLTPLTAIELKAVQVAAETEFEKAKKMQIKKQRRRKKRPEDLER